jgi:hypothetical protein
MSGFMFSIATIVVFGAAGVTLKLADYVGETSSRTSSYIYAISSGALLGGLTRSGADESSYVFGIVLGVALGGKIDRLNLLVGLLTFGMVAIVLGFSEPRFWLLATVTAFSLFDELIHSSQSKRNNLIGLLSRYRAGLKSATIVLAIASLISLTAAVGFLSFDVCYDLVSCQVE